MLPVVESCLMEAKRYAEAGTKPPKQQSELNLPDELTEALESDPELAEAFHGLAANSRFTSAALRNEGRAESPHRLGFPSPSASPTSPRLA